jgi:hypothetical protein
MASFQDNKLSVLKYYPLFSVNGASKDVLQEVQRPPIKINKPSAELWSELNQLAHAYPFCIMYKTKTNDPL